MSPNWWSIIGLVLDLIGASFLAFGLFVSKKTAVSLSVSRYSGGTDDENLELPQVQDRLKQSRNAKRGIVLLVLGFLLQIIGNMK
jgi:hypothetical protein